MKRILTDISGAAAIEFAVAAPIMAIMIFGVLQVGIYGVANAGIKQGVDEAARIATLYPRPTDTVIQAALLKKTFGLNSGSASVSITHGTQNGGAYVDINAQYVVPSVGFGFPTLSLSESRRAFQN